MEKVTKFLKKKSDGYIYPYTPELAARNDMLPHDEEPEVEVVVQDHLTVKMKWEAGLPLTQAEIIAYPKYMTAKVMGLPVIPEEAGGVASVHSVKVTRKYVRKVNAADVLSDTASMVITSALADDAAQPD